MIGWQSLQVGPSFYGLAELLPALCALPQLALLSSYQTSKLSCFAQNFNQPPKDSFGEVTSGSLQNNTQKISSVRPEAILRQHPRLRVILQGNFRVSFA